MDYHTQKSLDEIKRLVGNENLKEALRTAVMILETARAVTEARMREEREEIPGVEHGYWTHEAMMYFTAELDEPAEIEIEEGARI